MSRSCAAGRPPGRPARRSRLPAASPPAPDGATPGGDADSDLAIHNNDHPITVPAGGFDNAKMTVRIEWATVAERLGHRLYRDTNGNGAVDAGEPIVGTSQQGTTDFEQVSIPNPAPGSKYVFRVTNFASGPEGDYEGKVSFSQPFFQAAERERWTMTCESAETGKVGETVSVEIDRGQRKTVTFGSACRRVVEAGRCVGTPRRRQAHHRSAAPSSPASARASAAACGWRAWRAGAASGLDRYCVQGGGDHAGRLPDEALQPQDQPQDPQALRQQGDLHRLQQQALPRQAAAHRVRA